MHRATNIKLRLDSAGPSATWNLPPDWPAPSKILWCDTITLKAKLAHAGAVEREWDDPLDALDWIAGSITDHSSREAR